MRVKHGVADTNLRFAEVVAAFAADRRLAPIAASLQAERAEHRARRFGTGALKVIGKMFAMVVRGHLVVKLPKDRVSELVEASVGKHFDPGHGRLMKEWIVILSDDCSWVDLAKEAHDFCSKHLRLKTRKRKGSEL